MRSLVLAALVSMMVAGCTCQRGLFSNAVRTAAQILEPLFIQNNGADGYRFRYATDEQVREEEGSFVNGIWTVRGVVEWLSPEKDMKHTEMYVADDKGYQSNVMDVPYPRTGLSPGALASLTG